MAEWPFYAAVRTVRENVSGRAGLRAFRAAGGKVQDSTWFRMVGEARATVAAKGTELGRPLNRRPHGDEMTRWTTVKARGVLQQIEVIVKDRDTGEVLSIPFSVTGRRLMTRQAAIDEALSVISPDGTDGDRQQILGAIYVGTIIMEPGD